jgi:hypothetical protein
MLHSCGQTHFQLRLNSKGFAVDVDDVENYQPSILPTSSKKLYTAYLGQVNVDVFGTGETVSLEKYHTVNNKQLLVKVVDAQEHNLSEKKQYTLNKLKSLSSKKINTTDNEYYYVLTLLCVKKFAQINNNSVAYDNVQELINPFLSNAVLVERATRDYPELVEQSPTKSVNDYKKVYQKVIAYNSSIDIYFSTCNYLDFLFATTGLVSVNGLDSLVSINGVPNLDNAFFTGEYMVYGGGDKMFYPLTSLDVIGHELSHGLVSGTANLEYKGHSGALNEAFADIMGTMFEFYMYEKYPGLFGKKDWLIGEDLGMSKPFLRSMEDPNKGNQPDKYKGQHYLDPNSQTDFGGVHINSGIINYCFYLASQQTDKSIVLKSFINCLNKLEKQSNFMDFRDQLKTVSGNDPVLLEALNKVGLNDTAVSDYNSGGGGQPQQQPRGPPQPRYPQPRGPPQPRYPQPRGPPQPRYPQQPRWPPQPRYPQQPRWPPQPRYPQQQPRWPPQPRYPQQQPRWPPSLGTIFEHPNDFYFPYDYSLESDFYFPYDYSLESEFVYDY